MARPERTVPQNTCVFLTDSRPGDGCTLLDGTRKVNQHYPLQLTTLILLSLPQAPEEDEKDDDEDANSGILRSPGSVGADKNT